MIQDTTISTLLKKELERRLVYNASYSLRAFARDLGISAPRLSRILNENLGLSFKAANEIAKKIDFKGIDKELFLTLARSSAVRSSIRKKESYSQLKSIYQQKYSAISADTFQVISDWYHFAIVALVETKNFKNNESWIAQELGINKLQASQALKRLIRLGIILEENEKLSVSQTYLIESQHTSHEAIRNFHTQIIGKAVQAIHQQDVNERFLFSSAISIQKSKLGQFRELIQGLHNNAETEASTHLEKDAVYALSVQFFRLNNNVPFTEDL